ncbi:nucleoside hydrolase [Pseudomonadota bacterium]
MTAHAFKVFAVLACTLFLAPALTTAKESTAPTPVIVDTDMGFDDWMAILYLLNNPKVDVKAITVDCAGETYCPGGAINAARLIEIAGKEMIPVFYGSEPISTLDYQYPTLIRYGASTMQVKGFSKYKGLPFYTDNAPAHLYHMIKEAGKNDTPLTLISIGSATNYAHTLQLAKQYNDPDFSKGIKQFVKGGGAVGKVKDGVITNKHIVGNINIPTIFQSKNKTAEWNIYPNAEAASQLITSGFPITLVPLNLTGHVPITQSSYEELKAQANSPLAKFVVQVIIDNVTVQGGWGTAKLEYWDPAVVISALNPQLVTEKYLDVEMCVDTRNNKYHGTTYVNSDEKCTELNAPIGFVNVYTKIPKKSFVTEFVDVLNTTSKN